MVTALLQQHGKVLPQGADTQKRAAQKVMEILQDDELSHRPLLVYNICRLDDVLFETLKVLEE